MNSVLERVSAVEDFDRIDRKITGWMARYGLTGLVHRLHSGPFPSGTFLVNVVGCFTLGVLMTWVEHRGLGPLPGSKSHRMPAPLSSICPM